MTHISQKTRWWMYGMGLSILIVVCYFLARTANPYFRNEPKPISEVGEFSFVNQNGDSIKRNILDNKIALVYFFFTSCKNVCPLMFESVKKIDNAVSSSLSDNNRFLIMGHTCDPDTDGVERLSAYAQERSIIAPKWQLLTGEKKALYEAIRFYYKIHDAERPADKDFNFMHTQYIAIVKNGKVLYIVDGLKEKEIEDAIAVLKNLLS